MSSKKGITLLELLIVISLIGILVVYLLGSLNSFLKSRSTAQKLDTVQNTSTLVFNDINQEFHWAKEVKSTSPLELTVYNIDIDDASDSETKKIVFRLQDEQIFKDIEYIDNGSFVSTSDVLTPAEVKVTSFDIKNMADGSLPLININLEMETASHLKPLVIYEDSMTVSLRYLDLEISNP